MTKLQPSLMEVTRGLSECARGAHFDFSDDTALVAVQHLLWQTVDLFHAVAELGIKPANTFALGKVYSNSAAVIETLRARGVNVVESTSPEPGQFDQCFRADVNRLWELAARILATRAIKRILVLDDGGACITRIPAEVLNRYQVCGVEQTSLGIFLFEENPPPFAVMSWARTAVKLQIGGPIFSHCLLQKLQTHFLHGKSFQRENVGIIGLGSIGRALANLLVQQQNNVTFYDPDPELPVPDHLRGRVTRSESLEQLMLNCDFVFGCSGRNPFQGQWPMKHRPDIKLFSASGGDQEFGPIISDLKTRPAFRVSPLSWDISSDQGPAGRITIAYLGYPYNFVSRGIEAVPTSIVQVETGGLLAGLIQARNHLDLSEKGAVENSGIHRISPEAQRFVFETWRAAMDEKGIDLSAACGCDPATLAATDNFWWFVNRSEPRRSLTYEPCHRTETEMARILYRPTSLGLRPEQQLEADRCSF